MKTIAIENMNYELMEDNGDCFNIEDFKEKFTDYFYDYDYIVGDYAYNKLRLKGFCDKTNKKVNKTNDFTEKNTYIINQCAYKCHYFVLKKSKNA